MRRILRFLTIFLLCLTNHLQAQQFQILSSDIRTFRIDNAHAVKGLLPILRLGSGDVLNFSFDDLTHEYRRYTYKVEHCDYDLETTDELFESDYLAAAGNEVVIENYEQSLNTTVQYTHYRFSFPNAEMRPLLSGNYRLTVFREDEESGEPQPVITSYFFVVSQQVLINAEMTTNTEIDRNDKHQQLSMSVKMNGLPLRDVEDELKVRIVQNHRWDIAVSRPQPSYIMGDELIWEHHRDLIFKAGNEYRKFEMLSTRYPGMRQESMRWYEPHHHAQIVTDYPRPHYLFDKDRNGISVIRKDDSGAPETEAEYVYVHYRLEADYLPDHAIYINGVWTGGGFNPEYRMHYNPDAKAYEACILQKTGYYNYNYLAVDERQPFVGRTAPFEGDYYQTENEYTILIYYRRSGERYDRLVGMRTFHFQP